MEISKNLVSEARIVDASTLHAEVKVAEETEALRLAESDKERAALLERLTLAEGELEKLRTAAKQFPVRDIYVLDHPPLLQDALTLSKTRLMIISPWIRAKVVNHDFIKKLELLRQRAESRYTSGLELQTKKTKQKIFTTTTALLWKASPISLRHYPHFCLVRLGNTHAKVLIKDSEFLAVTSFNWLSFRGDPGRTFRDEQGTLVQQPQYVDNKFDELVTRIQDNLSDHKVIRPAGVTFQMAAAYFLVHGAPLHTVAPGRHRPVTPVAIRSSCKNRSQTPSF